MKQVTKKKYKTLEEWLADAPSDQAREWAIRTLSEFRNHRLNLVHKLVSNGLSEEEIGELSAVALESIAEKCRLSNDGNGMPTPPILTDRGKWRIH